MRGFVLQILVLASILDLINCFPGHRGYTFQECLGNKEASFCPGSPYSFESSTTRATGKIIATSLPVIRRPNRKDVEKLTATCDDDICSIWEVSSTVYTIITGPDYTPTATSSLPLSTGNSTSNGTVQTPSTPPFANSTTSNSDFNTGYTSGTGSRAPIITSTSTTIFNNTDENSSTAPSNSTATFLGTGGSTAYPPTQITGGIFTNTSSNFGTIVSSGTILLSASATITHGPSGIGPGGSAVSSGFFPSLSKTLSGVIWTNSTSIHGTGPRPSKTPSDANPRPTITVPQWAPWTIWTSNSEAAPTETVQPSNSESTSSSDSESTSYATTFVYTFSGTSYTIPIPASYTFLYGSTDTEPVSELSSTVKAVPSDASLGSSRTVSNGILPASTFGPTIQAKPTSMSFAPALTPADTSSAFPTTDFSSTSLETFSSCFTTTPTYQFDIPSPSPSPTLVCWGFSCNSSTCSDWLSSHAITSSNATATGAPYANATGTSLTGFYPTGTYSNVVGSTTANLTSVMATLTRTMYPVPSSTLTGGWGPWVEWTSTLSTSTTATSVNNTDVSTKTEEPSSTTSQPSGTGTNRLVGSLHDDGQYMAMGTPTYLRQMLQRRSIEAKRGQMGAAEDEGSVKNGYAVRKVMRGLFG